MSQETENEYLAMLPEGAPISRNIFQQGFFFNGKGIVYRLSLREAYAKQADSLGFVFDFLIKALTGILGIQALVMGEIGVALIYLFGSSIPFNLIGIYYSTIRPPNEINLVNKTINGIPFSEIDTIFIKKRMERWVRSAPRGIMIFLMYGFNDFLMKFNQAYMISLPIWEEHRIDIIVDSLSRLLEKNLKVVHDLDEMPGERQRKARRDILESIRKENRWRFWK